MKSMTGYGRGESRTAALRITVEITSVNRKQSDIVVNLPRDWSGLELDARKLVAGGVSRGRVQVQVQMEETAAAAAAALRVDRQLARQYCEALRALAKELRLNGEVTPMDLLRAPGVFQVGDAEKKPLEVWPLLEATLQKAMDHFTRSREREGAHLRKDLETRLKQIRATLKAIVAEAPEVLKNHREALRRRLEEAGLPIPLHDDRIVKELALHADRCDISEETARLAGHLDEFSRLLKSPDAPGRAMDFLAQEMNREMNTIGSKANSTAIAHLVVAGKTEVERIREQVQNVE
ncbi:MAG: YicC family protein [Verrucomicrobiales bacterium]|nr:YicC family protein [Verrucomicrobiales bacterium]